MEGKAPLFKTNIIDLLTIDNKVIGVNPDWIVKVERRAEYDLVLIIGVEFDNVAIKKGQI